MSDNTLRSEKWRRLERVIKWTGLSINSFALTIGLKRSENLYQIKKGNNGISRDLAELITAKYPSVSKGWLLTGEGVSIYVGEQFRGHGLGFQLLSALCAAAEKAGYWTLQSTVLQDNAASRALHAKCGFRLVGRRERIARDCHGRWLDTYLMERRAAADEPEGFKKL